MTTLRLTLIRHAKSSWKDPGLDDHDRPLNRRGLRDAPRMGERLRGRGFAPDLILTSTAARARLTAEAIARACGLADRVIARSALYHATPDELLDVVASEAGQGGLSHVALVGHNPGLTELVNRLTDADLENLPTCGVASIVLSAHRFADAASGGRLERLETPKNDPGRERPEG